MKAMIMAAGLGTRLLPLTRHTSKPMVPVVGRPVMEYLVQLLARHQISGAAVNLHHHAQQIREHFGDGSSFGLELRYHYEAKLSGTAGGVGLFRSFLDDQAFLVVSGDALTDADVAALLAHHRRTGGIATMAVKRVADPSRYGVVVADAQGRVVGFQEKPSPAAALSDLCNCGIYVFEPAIFDYVPRGEFVDWARHVFPRLLTEDVPFSTWQLDGYWNDVGSLPAYRESNFDVLTNRVDVAIAGELKHSGIWVGQEARISPRAHLEPPVFVGAGSCVAAGARLIGPAVVGDACVVDADAVVERSVLWHHCTVGSGACVSGALLGNRVAVSPGVAVDVGATIGGGCRVLPGGALADAPAAQFGEAGGPDVVSV